MLAHARPAILRTILMALTGALLLPCAAQAQWPEEDSGSFTGYWAMSGTVHILELPDGGLASAGGLTGSVTVQTSQGPVPSFETDCVIFADTRGGTGRCVWTATSGDLVLVELQSDGPAGSGRARGTFSGGTGRFASLSGRFQFEWSYAVDGGKDAELSGNTVSMSGLYRLRRR